MESQYLETGCGLGLLGWMGGEKEKKKECPIY
jgi:hypothetical protein